MNAFSLEGSHTSRVGSWTRRDESHAKLKKRQRRKDINAKWVWKPPPCGAAFKLVFIIKGNPKWKKFEWKIVRISEEKKIT